MAGERPLRGHWRGRAGKLEKQGGCYVTYFISVGYVVDRPIVGIWGTIVGQID